MPFLPSNLWLMAGSYIFCIVHRGSMVGRLVLTTNWLASHRTSGRMCVELVTRTIADHTLVNVTFYKDICHTHQRSNMSQNICLCMFIFPFFSFVPLSQSSWWSLGCNIPNQNKWFVVNNFQKYCHKICKEIVIVQKGKPLTHFSKWASNCLLFFALVDFTIFQCSNHKARSIQLTHRERSWQLMIGSSQSAKCSARTMICSHVSSEQICSHLHWVEL